MSDIINSSPQERLTIDNFCGIKHAELDLRPINLFIGPHAMGKSVVAKLTYLIKDIFTSRLRSIEEGETNSTFKRAFIKRFERYFPYRSRGKGKFKINYAINDDQIHIEYPSNGSKDVIFRLPTYLENVFSNYGTAIRKTKKDNQAVDDLHSNVFVQRQNVISNISKHYYPIRIPPNQVFIPSTRSFFAQIEEHVFSILQEIRDMDPFIQEFGQVYKSAKRRLFQKFQIPSGKKKPRSIEEEFISEILSGKFIKVKNNEYIEQSDGRQVRLLETSSGQQEILPIVIILHYIKELISWTISVCLYIEEPETHIFPNAQSRIIDFIAYIFNTVHNPVQLTITTHSPYILTALNTLVYAKYLQNSMKPLKSSKLESIVPANQMLDLDDISAYKFTKNEVISLVDRERGLIDASPIDEVSNELSDRFNFLLDLEYSK